MHTFPPIPSRRLAPAAIATLALGLALSTTGVSARGIDAIVTVDRSVAIIIQNAPYSVAEFNSRTATSSPVRDGHVVSFEHRLSWFAGAFGGTIRPTASAHLDFGLSFTVQDPLSQGYTLRLEQVLRGVLKADQGAASGSSNASMPSLEVSVYPAFEPHPIELPGLTTAAHLVSSSMNLSDEAVLNDRRRAEVGHWIGTRSFLVVLSSEQRLYADAVTPGLLQATAFAQFGRAPEASSLAAGYYTGPGNPSLGDLGHFLTVKAHFDTPPVPEPGTWLLMALGVAALLTHQRQTRTRA
jgi:hypothetical protein